MRYFITFACYGSHVRGDGSGSVDRKHNIPGSRRLRADPGRAAGERSRMDQAPYVLDLSRRASVLEAIAEVCKHRAWGLLAAHIRSTHAHVVVDAEVRPEKVMSDLKSYASRRLSGLGVDGPDRRRWARHGSTLWLKSDEDVRTAIRYVVDGQGEPMAVFVADGFWLWGR